MAQILEAEQETYDYITSNGIKTEEAHAARKRRRSAGWTGESRMSLIIAMLMLGIIIMIHELAIFVCKVKWDRCD